MRREAWSAMFMICGLVDGGFLMTVTGALADSSPEASLAAPANASAALWRQVALFLAGAAQLIIIPARVSPGRSGVLVVSAVGAAGPWGEPACAEEGVSRCRAIQDPVRKRAERCPA